jgi:hypothetical protein
MAVGAVSTVEAPPPADPAPPKGGPTLGALVDKYEARSTRASENVRYLAGAGIAVVWMLSRQQLDGLTGDLLRTLAACVGALTADFLHYVVAAFMFGRLKRQYENAGKVRQDFITIPRTTNLPGSVLYWTKIILLVIAFGSLVLNFVGRLRPPHVAESSAKSEAVCRAAPLDGELALECCGEAPPCRSSIAE